MRKALLTFALLLCASQAHATVYTVKAAGGGNYTTVQACATVAVAGDTCTIYAGTYSETVTPANNGTSASPITFSTNPGDTVTVTEWSLNSGSTYLVIEGTSANNMLVPSGIIWADHITHNIFQYVTTTGGGCWGGSGWYTSSTPTSYNQFLNSTIDNCGGTPAGPAIELEGDHNLFDGITCTYAQACITYSGEFNVIRNNTFGPTSAAVLGTQHSQPIENSVSCGTDIAGGSQHTLIENNYSAQWRGGNSHALLLMTDSSPTGGCGSTQNIIRLNQGMASGSYSIQSQDSNQNYYYNNSWSNTQLDNGAKDYEDFTFDPSAPNVRAINNIFSNMTNVTSTSWCIYADATPVENHNLCYNLGGPGTWNGPTTATGNTYAASDIFNSDPLFTNGLTDLHLASGSPAIGAGGPLTTAVGAGTASTALTVGDAGFFSAIAGMPGNYSADWIRIGTSTTVQIASINYATNVITLASPETWANGASIYLYKDSSGNVVLPSGNPNLGAFPAVTPLSTSNPLLSSYIPSMDTNCSHSQYASNIWVTDWDAKVLQNTGTNPGSSCTLLIYGTQNEFVDFQVHFTDPGTGTTGLNVVVSNFVQSAPNSATINCATLGQCVNYREGYINVNTHPTNNQLDSAVPGGTNQNTFYSGGPLGYYPDILIPAVDPYWGQTTNAWPFTVAAGKNQSAWIDVLIPATALSGYYLGSVEVQSGCPSACVTLATMPITIAVWQWPSNGSMPSTATLKTEETGFGYNVGCVQMYDPTGRTVNCGAYPGAGGVSDTANTLIWLDGQMLMKDHRYSSGGVDNYYIGSTTTYNGYVGPIMNGTCLHGGSYCPLLSGSKNTTKEITDLSPSSGIWSTFQSNFDTQGWGSAGTPPLYDYLQDEPHTSGDFTTVYNNGSTRHGYLTPAIAELVTTDIYLSQGSASAANTMSTTICGSTSCVLNQIDWLVTAINVFEPLPTLGTLQPTSAYNAWLTGSNPAGTQRHWFAYQACTDAGTCSNGTVGPAGLGVAYATYPNYDIDGKPAANRAMEWLTYLHGQTGELYYGADVCQNYAYYTTCDPSGTYVNGWTSLYSFGNWGDGTLIYFGSNEAGSYNYMGSGVTTPIYLPSIRLKLMRDGVQDYEYLYKLNALGYGTFVNTQLSSWVTNSYNFETSGAGLRSARLALGNQLHAITFPAFAPAPVRSGLLLANYRKPKDKR